MELTKEAQAIYDHIKAALDLAIASDKFPGWDSLVNDLCNAKRIILSTTIKF